MLSDYKIYIRGMVCDRCIQAIRDVFHELEIPVTGITLGEVTTVSALTAPSLDAVKEKLLPLGFTLLEDRRTSLVRELKRMVEEVYSGDYDFPQDFRFSDMVVKKFNRNYNVISNIFSEMEGITLEKYIMAYRMEKTKELLVYTDASLADIAFRLGFSSAAHLSKQFKSNTGLNTSHYKTVRQGKLSVAAKQHPSS
ncbi:MAG TPA: helix-turn-helix domain-containing protein [Chitinophaga sp.]|uniref:helix-turn-helix domain-containing protein n=1 Tax=Chitinophaga sp. TaxID=1869181 RepID=UPI002CC46501|nr:helix-turn-helix domain-containing protein [Chitinophaga sp.]HVI47135.1 helix-turn-helix domain-containing protein [Chitinophaga sp.]